MLDRCGSGPQPGFGSAGSQGIKQKATIEPINQKTSGGTEENKSIHLSFLQHQLLKFMHL